jgi:ribose transport system permease protein
MNGKIGSLVAKYSRILLLVLICVVMSFLSKTFLLKGNIINVLRQSSLYLIMSLGMLFALLLGRGTDMSIGATLALTSCLAAEFMQRDPDNPWIILWGILIAIGMAAVIGAVNGLIVSYFKLPAILVTLGTREIIRGVAYYFMSEKVIVILPSFITQMGMGKLWGIPIPIFIALGITFLSAFILRFTVVGRSVYLVGANERSAAFSGIRTKLVIIFGFVVSAVFSSLAGLIYIGRLSAAEPSIGADFAFECVSAVAIGGASFSGGIGTVWGTIIGSIILCLVLNALNLLRVSAYWQGAVNGAVVILAVLIDYLAREKSRGR